MADPTPPAKKSAGPLRWILLGCGALTGLFILGMGGCAGIFYFIYKGTDPIAEVGANHLKASTHFAQATGTPLTTRRDWTGWNVQTRNDSGTAYFVYSVRGPLASGKAEVWLVKEKGEWRPTGTRFQPSDGSAAVTTGTVPSKNRFGKDWD